MKESSRPCGVEGRVLAGERVGGVGLGVVSSCEYEGGGEAGARPSPFSSPSSSTPSRIGLRKYTAEKSSRLDQLWGLSMVLMVETSRRQDVPDPAPECAVAKPTRACENPELVDVSACERAYDCCTVVAGLCHRLDRLLGVSWPAAVRPDAGQRLKSQELKTKTPHGLLLPRSTPPVRRAVGTCGELLLYSASLHRRASGCSVCARRKGDCC